MSSSLDSITQVLYTLTDSFSYFQEDVLYEIKSVFHILGSFRGGTFLNLKVHFGRNKGRNKGLLTGESYSHL